MPHHRFRVRLLPVLCALPLALYACSKSPEVDERMTGAWHASLGQWTMTFEADADGRYRTTFHGPFAPPPPAETGGIEALDGEWQVRKDSGETDGGTYYFVSDNALVMQGGKGALTWQRGPAMPAPSSPAASTPAQASTAQFPHTTTPIEGEWPLRELPAIARKAGNIAREWQPDALLIGIDTELLQQNSPVVHNVDTPAGRVTLTLRFCSPDKQRSIVIAPTPEGGVPMGEDPFDCSADQAIGAEFMELPDAVAIARDRGMKAGIPKRASLKKRTSGVRGEDVFGVTWQIFSTERADQSYLIPTQPQSAATVRAVDPCRLITAAEAESALGTAVRRVPPHYQEPHTWNCIYQVGEDQRRRLSLKVDENPSVDSRGYMASQRRKGRKSVPDLADEAYLFDSPAGFAILDARLGDTLLKFRLGGPASGREQTITRLAHQAVQRLVAGDGITAEASPDAKLTGEWTTSTGGRTLLMVVREDKALTISVFDSRNGVLTTNGNRWELLDRARRALGSGSWESNGPDGFSTGGDIVATWRHVPDGSPPGSIATTLIAGTGVESDDATVSGPWPQMPLEAPLLGLWQGEGQIGRRNVQLAWRIRSNGPSTLIRAESGKGYVENVDRSQRVILNFSEELERIGRQLKLDFHDGAVVTGFPDDNHMVMQLHNLKLLEWTRAGTPSIARDVPKSGASPRVGGAVETVEPATSPPPREPGTTTETLPTQDASDAVSVEAEQATGNEEESARDRAARVGRKTVDIVEDAADTVGDFIEGIFGGQSSSGRKPDGSRSSGREFEPQDW